MRIDLASRLEVPLLTLPQAVFRLSSPLVQIEQLCRTQVGGDVIGN